MKKTAQGQTARTAAGAAAGASSVSGPQTPSGASSAGDEQRGTRNKVARSILDHGPSTAAELALRLELTQAAVRRHLDSLVGDGVVEPREKRVYGSRGRGRPAKVFALTDCGRDAFDQDYDRLAADALRWIAQSAGGGARGDAAVADFARARMAAQAERYRSALEGVPPEERARALAEALTEDGYAATARSAPASAGAPVGEQLCQHHCPVAHTAEQFPQLCEAETEVFSRLLGTHVQRLATIAHGDGVCTTFVPQTLSTAGRPRPPGGSPSQPRHVTQARGAGAGEAPGATSTAGTAGSTTRTRTSKTNASTTNASKTNASKTNASKTRNGKTTASNATTAPANTAGRNPA